MEVKGSPHGKIKLIFQSILPNAGILNASHDTSGESNLEYKPVVENKIKKENNPISYNSTDSPNTQVSKFIERLNQRKDVNLNQIEKCVTERKVCERFPSDKFDNGYTTLIFTDTDTFRYNSKTSTPYFNTLRNFSSKKNSTPLRKSLCDLNKESSLSLTDLRSKLRLSIASGDCSICDSELLSPARLNSKFDVEVPKSPLNLNYSHETKEANTIQIPLLRRSISDPVPENEYLKVRISGFFTILL